MAERIYLRPVSGRKVRIPNTNQHLPTEGAYVEDSPYWRRRVQTGDAVAAVPAAMADAYATVDAMAGLLEKSIAAGGEPDDAIAASVEGLVTTAAAQAANLDPRDAAQVDAYAATRLGPLRAKLEAIEAAIVVKAKAKAPAKAK